MMFDVTDHSTFRDRSDGQDVADYESGFLAAVHELAGVHPLGGHEQLLLVLVPERVAEGDSGEWGATTRVVDDLGHDSLQVPVSLTEVQAAEPGRTLAVVGVGLEYGSGTFSLSSDDSPHGLVDGSGGEALMAAK